eukprot:UN18286
MSEKDFVIPWYYLLRLCILDENEFVQFLFYQLEKESQTSVLSSDDFQLQLAVQIEYVKPTHSDKVFMIGWWNFLTFENLGIATKVNIFLLVNQF